MEVGWLTSMPKVKNVMQPELLCALSSPAMVHVFSNAEEKIEGDEGKFAYGFHLLVVCGPGGTKDVIGYKYNNG